MKVITNTSVKNGCLISNQRHPQQGKGVSSNAVKVETVKGLDSEKKIEEKKPIMNEVIKKLERASNNVKRKAIRFNP